MFLKIDLKEAYKQLKLHKNSSSITNFHGENVVYRFKRLCYGINNSFENFEETIACKLLATCY